MVGIALIGAGIFAREVHLPAIKATSLRLKAIYSRSQQSAETLASAARETEPIDVYFDVPATPGRSLADLLARADVAAVDICLPILTQPDVIKKAILAGKHVLSEKPIAGDVAEASSLVAWYDGLSTTPKPLWGVAENYRFIPGLAHAGRVLREIGGDVVAFRVESYSLMGQDSKWFGTAWRKTPQYQGGFVLDGGVHHAATLRLLLASLGQEVSRITAFTTQVKGHLPPVDTVHSAVELAPSGRSGTFSLSQASEFKNGTQIEVITTEGMISGTTDEFLVVRRGKDGVHMEETKEFDRDSGVPSEMATFAESIATGKLDSRLAVHEALKDLAVIEAILRSGEAGASILKYLYHSSAW